MTIRRSGTLTAMLLILLCSTGKRTYADTLELTGTNWMATFPLGVDLRWDAQNKLLTKLAVFTTLDPLTILFEQTKLAPVGDAGPDLILHLAFDIAENITGQDWFDFHLTLNDLTPGVNHNNPGGVHPAFPHFHTHLLGANATFAPLVLVSRPESQNVMDLGLGSPVINGGSEDMRDFVIHEWENENGEPNDILRRFELVEQPTVPESDTIAQVGIGILALVTCAFRRYILPH